MKLPSVLVYPFVVLGALLYGRFRLWESDSVKSVKQTGIPILLIHGEDDRFVPCSMSKEIYAACAGPKKLLTIPEAGHGLCYLVAPALYEDAVADFMAAAGVLK